jgi:hypothetical protein
MALGRSGDERPLPHQRYLLVGLPRGGTTWISRALAATPGLTCVEEPDNPASDTYAIVALHRLGWLAAFSPVAGPPREYRLMWDVAFRGGWPTGSSRAPLISRLRCTPPNDRIPFGARRSLQVRAADLARRVPAEGPVLVKSVAVQLITEWLAATYKPRVVMVWRHPLNVLPTWLELKWDVAYLIAGRQPVIDRFSTTALWPPPAGSGLEPTIWALCAQEVILLEAAARHPDWTLVSHEATCLDPVGAIHELVATLGLEWSDRIREVIEGANTAGSGFIPHRVAADEPTRWRTRLTSEQAATADRILRRFADESLPAAAHWANSPAMS